MFLITPRATPGHSASCSKIKQFLEIDRILQGVIKNCTISLYGQFKIIKQFVN